MSWLRDDLEVPERAQLPTGHHMRGIRESDVDIDFPAVMSVREKLWAKYGEAWGWPPETMSYEQDKKDLKHHEDEIAARETFNYAVLNEHESALFGCVYIDPAYDESHAGADAVASWWAVDPQLEAALDEFVPRWLEDVWGFRAVKFWP